MYMYMMFFVYMNKYQYLVRTCTFTVNYFLKLISVLLCMPFFCIIASYRFNKISIHVLKTIGRHPWCLLQRCANGVCRRRGSVRKKHSTSNRARTTRSCRSTVTPVRPRFRLASVAPCTYDNRCAHQRNPCTFFKLNVGTTSFLCMLAAPL